MALTDFQIGESMDAGTHKAKDKDKEAEPERAHGREGLFVATILSLCVFMVATSWLDDYQLGILVAGAVTLVPAAVLTFRPSTRSFAIGMLIGTVVGLAIELVFLEYYLDVL